MSSGSQPSRNVTSGDRLSPPVPPASADSFVAGPSVRTEEGVARPVEAMLRDPLSDVARKERRSLLGVSVIAILVGKTGLVPAKIENLGVTFTAPERTALLWVFMMVVVYYTLAFAFYATSDFLTYLHSVHLGRQEIRRQRLAGANVKDNLMKPGDPEVSSPWRLTRWVAPASVFRAIIDFVVPVPVAVYAIVILWGATHTAIQPKPTPTTLPSPLDDV